MLTAPHPFYLTWAAQRTANALEMTDAQEDFFILQTGRKVYDMVSTSFQASFGHSHQGLLEKIREQTRGMMVAPPKAQFELKTRASRRLQNLLRLDGGKIFYTVSGAESVENALKMARQVTGRETVCARSRSYHGASLGALTVTGDWRQDHHIFFDAHVLRIPEPTNDPEGRQMREVVLDYGPQKIAAVIVETITGANGVIIPPLSWWKGLNAIRSEFGIKLILDEVLTGFGRTGHDFAFHSFGITPDFVVMGKAISGGYVPFGAVWTSQEIAGFYDDHILSCGLTSFAHPLGLAAMEAVLDQLADGGFRQKVGLLSNTLDQELGRLLVLNEVKEVRQAGLLAAVEFARGPVPTYEECLEAGLHLLVKEREIILAPPLIMAPDTLSQCIRALRGVIQTKRATSANSRPLFSGG